MYSKFQPINPNHLWTGGDPIYGTSDEKTMTLALIEDYLADQRDGTGAFFTYHFPLPLRTTCSESSLGWKEKLAGNSAWASLCVHYEPLRHCRAISGGTAWAGNKRLQEGEGYQSDPLNMQMSWLHPQLISRHSHIDEKELGTKSASNAEKKFAILLA